jgi:hypothetical protein
MNTPRRSLLALAAFAATLSLGSIPAEASRIDGHGHVFTTTNDAAGNAVLVYAARARAWGRRAPSR